MFYFVKWNVHIYLIIEDRGLDVACVLCVRNISQPLRDMIAGIVNQQYSNVSL